MFGIDLGISVSSVSLVGQRDAKRYNPIDSMVIFGDKKEKREWIRITAMAEAICGMVDLIGKGHPDIEIEPWVAIEEPVYPYRTRNPRSYFQMSCLYALVRKKLQTRLFKAYSINPISVKSTARHLAFKDKKLKAIYYKGRSLTKKGMVRAYKKLNGKEPQYRNAIGRETMADSFFIAVAAIERKKLGIKT